MSDSFFLEKDFNAALHESISPDVISWEFFVESHGLNIYRSLKQGSQLYEYKVIGEIDVDAKLFASVYMDIEYRNKWDSYVKELKFIEESKQAIIYWEVAYPWPLANRDYVYSREMRTNSDSGKESWIVLARSANSNEMPKNLEVEEKKGVVRVTDYQQTIVVTDNGENSSKIFMHYYDDPKGNIPAMVINWAAKTGVPSFLTNMKKACRNYFKK